MGRRKIVIEWIADRRKRKATFEKRKRGIEKKANEFAILTGSAVTLRIQNEAVSEERIFGESADAGSSSSNTAVSPYSSTESLAMNTHSSIPGRVKEMGREGAPWHPDPALPGVTDLVPFSPRAGVPSSGFSALPCLGDTSDDIFGLNAMFEGAMESLPPTMLFHGLDAAEITFPSARATYMGISTPNMPFLDVNHTNLALMDMSALDMGSFDMSDLGITSLNRNDQGISGMDMSTLDMTMFDLNALNTSAFDMSNMDSAGFALTEARPLESFSSVMM